ncbi:MAG TPA: phage holin family protein [Burkholderiaceae bacterium]|nr:phage holin family protein [Burkholderiaceae bacterium]
MSATVPPPWRDEPVPPVHATSLGESIRRCAAGLVAQMHLRLELLQCDIAREKIRLETLAIAGALALFFGLLTLLMGVFVILALTWDTPYRVPTVVGLALVSLIAAAVSTFAAMRARRDVARPFESTLDELAKDRRAIEDLQ